MTETLAPTITYCTLARVGHWASLDARCRSCPDGSGMLTHYVHFVLTRHGERIPMGFSIISQTDQDVWDEDGDGFPSLDAAIRSHADEYLRITPMPGIRVAFPPRHDLTDDTVGTAFPKDKPGQV